MVPEEEILLKGRIRQMLTYERKTISKLSDNDTIRVRLGRQINNPKTSVPFSTLYMLLRMFPDIDANWLLLGEGEMKKQSLVSMSQSNVVNGSNSGTISNINGSGEDLIRENEQLRKDKEFLQSMLKSFTKK